jgi:hypothetical protein
MEDLRSQSQRFQSIAACGFPADVYDDIFTPGSRRREEYLSASRFSQVLNEMSEQRSSSV